MLCRIFRFFAVVTIVFTPMLGRAGDIPAITITDKTNPKIAELYQKLQDKNAEIAGIESERRGALEENATAMYEKEQSLENKALTATTTVATGLGAMEAASAYAEQLADADAAEEMSAYITTMRCEYGNGKQVNLGKEETLPGGNELSRYYTEYKQLAEKLKATKAALGLRPGIESEILYDRAESGIYQYQNAEQQSGAYTSLSRALMNPEGEDATKIAAQKQENSEKLKTGLIAAGGGIVAGAIGNYEINKDAPKESSTEINREYDDKVAAAKQERTDIETKLTAAIEENAKLVAEYNAKINELKLGLAAIKDDTPDDCQKLVEEYVSAVNDLELIENETDLVPDVAMPEMDSDLLAQCVQCKNKGADFNSVTKECKCPADKPVEKGGQCVEKPTEVIPVVEEQPRVEIPVSESQEIEKETPKADYCPKTGNALKSINDTHKVGDNCTSDIISQGTITKRQNGTCTCNATGCWTPYTPKGGKCVKVEGTSTDAGGSDKTGDAYIDENGFCKPYKIKEWFFNKESSADISKKFQKLCDEAAKAHNCKRKDLNTSRLIEKDDSGAVQYEWTCNADSEDYLATQERINQRHANLSYENVCKKLKPGTTNQEGQIKRGCFGIFEDIDIPDYKTQLELAKARIGTSSACSEKREVRRSTASNNPVGYYTNCNTTNDKERYTFIFTGVGNDNTTPENLMRAACATYGVEFGAQGGELGRKQPYCSYAYKSIDNDPTCNKINALAQKFGYTARIVRGTGCVLDTTGTVGGDQLAKSGMRSDEKITILRTAFGIDNNMFANISTNMDEWLYDQMRINIANEMKRAGHSDPLVKFECFPAKSFALDKGVEFKLFGNTSGRNVLTCQANGHDIDFVFAQLGRSTKRRANASQEGLTCIFGSNGKYDGRQCWGVTEDDCKKLDAAIKENAKTCSQCGAKWDTNIGGCTLTKSTKVEKTNKGLEIAGNIALIAGGAVLTVMSGGMAMPMLVTELALMGVEITGATVAAVEEKHMRNVANEFLAKTQYCHDAECAQQLLNDTEVHRILNLESNLDEKQSKVIDDKLAELLRVIPADAPLYVALVNETENKQNCNFWRNATAQCEWAQFVHAWANVAQFASLGVALGRSAVRFINARKAIIEVAEQTTKKMTRAQAKRIGEIDKEINKIESVTPGRRTAKQAEDLKKLRQERNTILNKVGTKDADEVAKLSADAYNPKIEEAQSEYQKLLKEREALAKRIGTDKAPGKVELQTMDKQVVAAEKKLKDLGADVEPVEPLWKADGKTTTPKKTEPKPAEPTTTPKEPEIVAPKSEPAPKVTGGDPYTNMDPRIKAKIDQIKTEGGELGVARKNLTDDQWKTLKEDLAKDGVEVKEQGSAMFVIKKPTVTSTPAKMTVSELAKKDTKTIIDEAKNLSSTQRSELYLTLTPAQRNSIAKMKVDSKTVSLPFGSNIDDLAKNPELLDITGDYLPLNQKAVAKVAAEPKLSRFNDLNNKRRLYNRKRTLEDLKQNGKLTSDEAKELKQLDNVSGLTVAERQELEQLANDRGFQSELKELQHMLSDDVSVDAILANGTQYKEKLLNIISSDPSLRRQAQNFDKLSKTQKENFMNRVAKELDVSFSGGDPKLKINTNVKYIDSWSEAPGYEKLEAEDIKKLNSRQPGASGANPDGSNTVYILNTFPKDLGYGNKLNDTMALFAHEYGHAMDGIAAEKVATGGSSYVHDMLAGAKTLRSDKTYEAFAEYIYHPTELSSRGINEVVGTNFTTDLANTIKAKSVKMSPISDFQKLKIQSGYTGANSTFVPSPKATNKLGVDYYKYEPPSTRTGSLQPIVDNIKERGIEHVAVIKEDGKDVVAIFDNADDYNAAMKKLNISTPKSTPKPVTSGDDAGVGNTARGMSNGASSSSNTAKTDEVADAARKSNKAGVDGHAGTDIEKNVQYMGKLKGFKVSSVNRVKDNGSVSVFKFVDEGSGKTYYLKHTDEIDEITRTKRAYEILNGESDIVHTVRVIEDDQNVLLDFATKHNLTTSSGKYWFVMDDMPAGSLKVANKNLTSSNIEYLASIGENPLQTVFGGKKITLAEQEEILKAVKKLDDAGLSHGDLYSNMFFMREPNGKLRVDIIDYEPWSAKGAQLNTDAVQGMLEDLSKQGLVQKATPTSPATSAGRGASNTTKKTDELANLARNSDKADDVVRDSRATANSINVLKGKASPNFDRDLAYLNNDDIRRFYLKKNKLSDEEWKILREDLNKKGFDIVDAEDDATSFWVVKKAKSTPKPAGPTTTPKAEQTTIPKAGTVTTPKPAQSKYQIKKTIKPFGNYTGGQKEANGVFEIVDNQTGQIMYLKRTSANEVNMTKRAANVNLGTNSVVRVVQPVDMTPAQIDDIAKSLGITVPDYVKADTWLLTKAVPEGEDLMTIVKNGGKLNDGTKITNAEIDKIISDMKNLRNAGVNHTDLYTNTIIRRTANGKLEAYIIDFESAGIHDVNFIEKEMDKIRTIEGPSKKASNAVTEGNRAPFMTANRAERKNVAQIKKDIAPGMPDGYFDATLKRFKKDGQSVVFDSNLTTDEGWELLNKSIKEENIQLVDDGFGNKVFRRARNEVADKVGGNSDVYLDPNELVRFVGNEGKEINSVYIKNAKEARQYLDNAIDSGKYVRSLDDYIETMNEGHRISAMGLNGDADYYAAIGKDSSKVHPGQIRTAPNPMSNDYENKAFQFEQIAKQYGDPYRTTGLTQIELPGIPKNNLPYNRGTQHVYPGGGDALRPYYKQMHRTAKEALDLIDSGASERVILEKIAEHYNYAIAARPYGQINNSLFMNEVNTLLRKAGLKTMPQGELDFAAMFLQPSTFKKYFIDTYYKTRL